jgi:hypothetical protein
LQSSSPSRSSYYSLLQSPRYSTTALVRTGIARTQAAWAVSVSRSQPERPIQVPLTDECRLTTPGRMWARGQQRHRSVSAADATIAPTAPPGPPTALMPGRLGHARGQAAAATWGADPTMVPSASASEIRHKRCPGGALAWGGDGAACRGKVGRNKATILTSCLRPRDADHTR